MGVAAPPCPVEQVAWSSRRHRSTPPSAALLRMMNILGYSQNSASLGFAQMLMSLSRDRSELCAKRADTTSDYRQSLFIDVVMDIPVPQKRQRCLNWSSDHTADPNLGARIDEVGFTIVHKSPYQYCMEIAPIFTESNWTSDRIKLEL